MYRISINEITVSCSPKPLGTGFHNSILFSISIKSTNGVLSGINIFLRYTKNYYVLFKLLFKLLCRKCASFFIIYLGHVKAANMSLDTFMDKIAEARTKIL